MRKFLSFALAILVASCSRAVTPAMLDRVNLSKSGSNAAEVDVSKEAEFSDLSSGDSTQAKTAEVSIRPSVTFVFGNGDPDRKVLAVSKKIPSSLVPDSPSRPGYNFKGWYFAPDRKGGLVNFDELEVTSSLTVYAGWLDKNHTVDLEITYNYGTCDFIEGYDYDTVRFKVLAGQPFPFDDIFGGDDEELSIYYPYSSHKGVGARCLVWVGHDPEGNPYPEEPRTTKYSFIYPGEWIVPDVEEPIMLNFFWVTTEEGGEPGSLDLAYPWSWPGKRKIADAPELPSVKKAFGR